MLKTSKCINYNFTSCLKLSGWWVWYFWDVKNKGPGAIGKFLFILWKICHQFSEILVDPLIFLILPNFVEPYQSPKASSSCLRVGQIFFRCEIWQIFQFTSHDLKECHNWENLILLFKFWWDFWWIKTNFESPVCSDP